MEKGERIGRNDINNAVTKLEASNREKALHMADSLREVLDSNAYECISVSDNPSDIESSLQALRIIKIGKRTDTLLSISFCFPEFADKKRQLLSAIRRKSHQISPALDNVSREQERLFLNTLNEAGFSTVALMTLTEDKTTRKPTFKIFFPKAFMNVDPSFPPSSRKNLGIAVAAYFLKKVPIK